MGKFAINSIVIILILMAGCASQLAVKEIWVEPKEVSPGDNAKVCVVVKGATDKVSKIIATVREAPDMYFSLNDDGKDGDEKARDNIWSYEIIVPWEAYAGTFHVDFSIYDKEGSELVTKGLEQQRTGRSGTVEVFVK